jgi:alpha-D-ribose 1-methylphosphonate 5-triphosphate diphosphatase
LQTLQGENVHNNLRRIVELCRSLGLPIASHDDTTAEQVRENVEHCMALAEFPTTLEAAREAKRNGLAVIMGAPNIVRGGSHSGNISATDLARENLLDILSSDYMPASLLHAVFLLPELAGFSLSRALETVTSAPAKAVGLEDRGVLAPGKRADTAQVRLTNGVPVVRAVWREGRRVL